MHAKKYVAAQCEPARGVSRYHKAAANLGFRWVPAILQACAAAAGAGTKIYRPRVGYLYPAQRGREEERKV
jgi:hypothetical protein